MELIILDQTMQKIGLIETAKVLWSVKYYTCGDFEIYFDNSPEDVLLLLQEGNYVIREDDFSVGIIEDIEITEDAENGSPVSVKGRMAESILDRRIIMEQTTLNGSIEDCVYSLIMDAIINPSDSNRKISNFRLKPKKNIPVKISSQVTGRNLLEYVSELCASNHVGMKVTLEGDNFYFELYEGRDCSYGQNANPRVVFSEEYENLESSSYKMTTSTEKNVVLVAGEGEGKERRVKEVDLSGLTGIDRKELYIDARDLSSNNGEITEEEYDRKLVNRGLEKISEYSMTVAFQGDIDIDSYEYKKDFFLGDVVNIENQNWKIYTTPRIVEILECEDETGYSLNPTFGE